MRMKWLFAWFPRSLVGRVFALYTITLLAFVVAGLGLFYRYQFAVSLEYEQQRTMGWPTSLRPLFRMPP